MPGRLLPLFWPGLAAIFPDGLAEPGCPRGWLREREERPQPVPVCGASWCPLPTPGGLDGQGRRISGDLRAFCRYRLLQTAVESLFEQGGQFPRAPICDWISWPSSW